MGSPRVIRRLPRVPVPLVGYGLGLSAALAGVFLLWGLAVTLLAGGLAVAASFVLAYAGDDRPNGGPS